MKLSRVFIMGVVMAGWWDGQSLLADLTPGDNPFSLIVARNIFGLLPIPTNPPVEASSAVPPAKITPNGIITIFGTAQVLFKVLAAPVLGQPPIREQSYMLGEGESEDGIEVQKINKESAIIIFNNHGTIQELPLIAGTAANDVQTATAGVASSITPGPAGSMTAWRRVHRPHLPIESTPAVSLGLSPDASAAGVPSPEPISPEAQANSDGATP